MGSLGLLDKWQPSNCVAALLSILLLIVTKGNSTSSCYTKSNHRGDVIICRCLEKKHPIFVTYPNATTLLFQRVRLGWEGRMRRQGVRQSTSVGDALYFVDDKGVGHEEKFSRNPRVNRTGCVVCACVYCGVRRIVFARNRIFVHFVHAVVFFSRLFERCASFKLAHRKIICCRQSWKIGQNISNFFRFELFLDGFSCGRRNRWICVGRWLPWNISLEDDRGRGKKGPIVICVIDSPKGRKTKTQKKAGRRTAVCCTYKETRRGGRNFPRCYHHRA